MSDGPENLMLVSLRRIDQRLERAEIEASDVKHHLGRLEEGQSLLRQQMANLVQSYAGVQVRLDRPSDRVDRVERRLDLHEARA